MQAYGVIDVFDTEAAKREQIDVIVDKEKAILSGAEAADIERTLRALMADLVVA